MSDPYLKYYNLINKANLQSAKQQMDFQKDMSNTAHQREVKDLIKAGLNPVLSANNGASTPGGSYANVDSSAISAKFARSQANAEMRNQLKITAMNNAASIKIAREQMANQMALAVYQYEHPTDIGGALSNLITGSGTAKELAENVLSLLGINTANGNNGSGNTSSKKNSNGITIGHDYQIGSKIKGIALSGIKKLYGAVNNYSKQRVNTRRKVNDKYYALRHTANGKDLSNFVGDLGYIPKGKVYDKNGNVISAKKARSMIYKNYGYKAGAYNRKKNQYYNALQYNNNLRKIINS